VIDVACHRDHQVGGQIALVVIAGDAVPGQRVDRLDGAEDRPAQRSVAVQRDGEFVVHEVGGIVVAHGDLFEDHAALGVDVLRIDQRGGHHVGDDVDRQRQILVEHPRVVAGVLLGGESVEVTAHRVHRRGDLHRGPPPGALEQQMLEVVGRPCVLDRLVP
jgi:hypothetical protein